MRRSFPKSASLDLTKNWYISKGLVLAGSSQIAFPAVLPYLLPSSVVTNGTVRPEIHLNTLEYAELPEQDIVGAL